MKAKNTIAFVIAHPGKTACELAKAAGAPVDQLSSQLNRLVKAKRLQRRWRPGQRKCAHAFRYWPVYSFEIQEQVVALLHDFARDQQIRLHVGGPLMTCDPFKPTKYKVNFDHITKALHGIMSAFERGVASVQ